MIERVEFNLPEDHPILDVELWRYTETVGAERKFEWPTLPLKRKINQKPHFKTALQNAKAQYSVSQKQYITSTVFVLSENCVFCSCAFQIRQETKTNIHVFGLFLDSLCLKVTSQVMNIVKNKIVDCSLKIKATLEKNGFLPDITHHIRKAAFDISSLMHVGLDAPVSLSNNLLEEADKEFLSAVLKSHLNSQMTTIIEAETLEEALPIYSMLSHFLFPFQMSLSSFTLMREPSPDLYLQCVDKSLNYKIPLMKMLKFDKPWAWIRVSEKQVFESPDIVDQKKFFRAFKARELCDDEKDKKLKLKKFLEMYRITQVLGSNWSREIIRDIFDCNKLLRCIACEKWMSKLYHKGLLMIEIYNSSLSSSSFLMCINEIKEQLGILDDDLFRTLVIISGLFSKKILHDFLKKKRGIVISMIASI